jgi:hypothetical protein
VSPRLAMMAAGAVLTTLLGRGCGAPQQGSAGPAPPGASAKSAFRDLTQASGLGAFVQSDGGSGRKFYPEQLGSGVAIFDFDGDGWQDVYFCSGAPLPGYKGPRPSNRLFRNRHDGTFEDVTDRAGVGCGHYCVGVAAGDYDNDGRVDLYLTCYGPNVLYHNNGDGTFTDITARAGVGDPRLSSSAAWGDYDGDGYLDLYVANNIVYDIKHDFWCSKFAGHKSYCGPTAYKPDVDTLYHNNGDGTFTDVSERAGIRTVKRNGLGVVWLDYDADGRQDICVANDQTPNLLWHNNGNGTFTDMAAAAGIAFSEEGVARAGMGIDAGDYDNDGRPDLTVTNFSEESNALYHYDGQRFRDVAMSSGMGTATLMYLAFGTGFLDYDRDGWLDLFCTNGHVLDDIGDYSDAVTWAEPSQLFHNRGNGTFEDASVATGVGAGRRVGRGAAFGDLDNDGRPDILVSSQRGQAWYLHNECAPAAHWLGLELKAAWGNPQAIGATIWLKSGGITQRRDVRANASYASSNDVRPLFGLGPNTKIDSLKIQWPGGETAEIASPPIDRYLHVDGPARATGPAAAAAPHPAAGNGPR